MICLDTHALLWWTLDPGRLSALAANLCREMEQNGGYASAISIWELGWKIKQGRLDLGMPIEQFVSLVKSNGRLEFVAADERIWLESLALDWTHRDPADRAIVATARELKVPLLTNDRVIQDFLGPDALW